MNNISIQTFAHDGTAASVHTRAKESLAKIYGFTPEDPAQGPYTLLYLLTGGSEASAVKHLNRSVFQILIADSSSNAYAAAMEVKAYAMANGYSNVLLCLDDDEDKQQLDVYLRVASALGRLKGKRLGLIGQVSEWLVASSIGREVLKEKLGIDLVEIPWAEAGNFRDYDAGEDFLECYHAGRQFDLEEAGRVEALLRDLVDTRDLDALTVECFSLVRKNKVTACLSLSFLNDLGIPAGCEGDLCSITGMMIAREIFGEIPWMANVAGIQGKQVLMAHCTAPTKMLSEYHVNTHFETGEGAAVHGRLEGREVSIFRINNSLDELFYTQGTVVEGRYRKNACRTQLNVLLPEEDVFALKNLPLGNHHLVIPGNWMNELEVLARVMAGRAS